MFQFKMDKECEDTMCTLSNTNIVGMILKTPLGAYTVKVCGTGVHSVNRVRTWEPESFDRINVLEVNEESLKAKTVPEEHYPGSFQQKVVTWFHLYFTNHPKFEKVFANPIPICTPNATDFQKQVWTTLQSEVPFGSTTSYGELANLINRPRAARAVGTAMKNNPNAIIVPCHRVLKASSDIGNYNGGVEIKTWLLDHESKTKNLSTSRSPADSA